MIVSVSEARRAALGHLGDPQAEAEFLALARDSTLPDDLRNGAFGGAIEVVGNGRNYTAIKDLATEWVAAIPSP